MSKEYDYLIKLIVVGEPYVGKTTLINAFCENYYSCQYYSTIGVDFKTKIINIDDKLVKVQIWDTAGQERFRSIINSYYHGAQCVILMFDLTNISTFDKLDYWYNNIELNINREHKILLVGSKIDERDNIILDTNFPKRINEFASSHNMDYIEISSKNNINIDKVFQKLVKDTIDDPIMKIQPHHLIPKETIVIQKPSEEKKCCC